MAFWIFMLVMNLLIPLTMIAFGKIFISKPPKDINSWYGYRTSMSMKNKETWNFAHHYCGKLWYVIGWIMLVISIIAMMFVFGKDKDTVGEFCGLLCGIQCIFLILPIIPTEIALRKNFSNR